MGDFDWSKLGDLLQNLTQFYVPGSILVNINAIGTAALLAAFALRFSDFGVELEGKKANAASFERVYRLRFLRDSLIDAMEILGSICFFSTIIMLINRGNDSTDPGGALAVLSTNLTTVGLLAGVIVISLRITRGRS